MEDEKQNYGPTEESEETDPNANESRTSRMVGRFRDTFGAAREGVIGTVDTVTGVAFREQFEDFTDAVTTAVVGVHQDQVEVRDRLTRLEQRSESTTTPAPSHPNAASRSPLAFGIVSVLALIVSFIALLKAFGAF